MKNLVISQSIKIKLLEKHFVRRVEIEECFKNRRRQYLEDLRVEHHTDPPTYWFISRTHQGRLLKVVIVFDGSKVYLKTAFEPNSQEIAIYDKYA
ncbi:MAG: hypothetical protein RLY99_1012 [Pseudomonadota bacterium]|jgi:hypothetical protein